MQWRKQVRPQDVVCRACAKDPRSHYMHLIGHCKLGRPIIYSCLELAKNKVFEDNRDHMIQVRGICGSDLNAASGAFSHVLRHPTTTPSRLPVPRAPLVLDPRTSYFTKPSATKPFPQTFEWAVKCMPPGVEQWIWVCDFKGFGMADVNPKLAKVPPQHTPAHLTPGVRLLLDAAHTITPFGCGH